MASGVKGAGRKIGSGVRRAQKAVVRDTGVCFRGCFYIKGWKDGRWGGGGIKSMWENLVSKRELSAVVPKPDRIPRVTYMFLHPSSCRSLGIIHVASFSLIHLRQYLSTPPSHHPHATCPALVRPTPAVVPGWGLCIYLASLESILSAQEPQ